MCKECGIRENSEMTWRSNQTMTYTEFSQYNCLRLLQGNLRENVVRTENQDKKMLLRNNIQIFFTNSIHNVCAKVSAVDYIDIIFVYKIKNCRSHGFSLYTYSAKAMSMTFIYIKMNACDNLFNV